MYSLHSLKPFRIFEGKFGILGFVVVKKMEGGSLGRLMLDFDLVCIECVLMGWVEVC